MYARKNGVESVNGGCGVVCELLEWCEDAVEAALRQSSNEHLLRSLPFRTHDLQQTRHLVLVRDSLEKFEISSSTEYFENRSESNYWGL